MGSVTEVGQPQGGEWIVVDFKTDRIQNEAGVERLLAHYADQMKRYAAAVEALVGQRPVVKLCLLNDRGGVTVMDFAGNS